MEINVANFLYISTAVTTHSHSRDGATFDATIAKSLYPLVCSLGRGRAL